MISTYSHIYLLAYHTAAAVSHSTSVIAVSLTQLIRVVQLEQSVQCV